MTSVSPADDPLASHHHHRDAPHRRDDDDRATLVPRRPPPRPPPRPRGSSLSRGVSSPLVSRLSPPHARHQWVADLAFVSTDPYAMGDGGWGGYLTGPWQFVGLGQWHCAVFTYTPGRWVMPCLQWCSSR